MNKITLGEKLRFLRLSRQYTQQEMSGYLHMERAAYSNYENNRRAPSRQHLVRIADFFEVRVDYLVRDDFTGNPYRRPHIAEQALRDFCRLEPEKQEAVAAYLHYCVEKKDPETT